MGTNCSSRITGRLEVRGRKRELKQSEEKEKQTRSARRPNPSRERESSLVSQATGARRSSGFAAQTDEDENTLVANRTCGLFAEISIISFPQKLNKRPVAIDLHLPGEVSYYKTFWPRVCQPFIGFRGAETSQSRCRSHGVCLWLTAIIPSLNLCYMNKRLRARRKSTTPWRLAG